VRGADGRSILVDTGPSGNGRFDAGDRAGHQARQRRFISQAPQSLRGRQQDRASVVDVTPTILYFLGLPIGRDMDGYARTDLFRRSFTDERPITFIPTYDR